MSKAEIRRLHEDLLEIAHALQLQAREHKGQIYVKEALEDADTSILNDVLPKIEDALRLMAGRR